MKKLVSFKIICVLLACLMLCSVVYASFSVVQNIKTYVEGLIIDPDLDDPNHYQFKQILYQFSRCKYWQFSS